MKEKPVEYPQFWSKVVSWQRLHGRHELPWQGTRDPYCIWVSEIMLQQTQVGSVIGYFEKFLRKFPDVAALARASEDEVLSCWSGLGYYARARNLHKAARQVVELHGGVFPRSAKLIEELPGIGRSTAAAIAAFAFGERGAILDGNVKRVLARHFGVEGFPGSVKIEAKLWGIATELLPPEGRLGGIEEYTQGLMDLGATVCTRTRPACDACPVRAGCVARTSGRVDEFPGPRPKRMGATRKTTWLVLRHKARVLLARRPSHGVWGGLLVFPEITGNHVPSYCLAQYGCVVSESVKLPRFVHTFTHFKLEIDARICVVERREPRMKSHELQWLSIDQALAAAVPAPVKRVLASL